MKLQGSSGRMCRFLLLSGVAASLLCVAMAAGSAGATAAAPEVRDTREGEDVSLSCRFAPQVAQQNPTYFWLRVNTRKHDNVAIGDAPLDTNYRLDFRPEQGRYDLLISNVSYERDNGRFECRVKAPGSGLDLHSHVVALTVLTPPDAPVVTPGVRPVATEGKPMQLSCGSTGGSPDPVIRWYKEGNTFPLEATMKNGASRDVATTAVLTVNASRTDDGAVYRCVVWNRAMPEGTKLETVVTLSVNYFPRVEIGPDNPVRVERDGTATLQCNVDAKPRVSNVRWTRNGRFVATSFTHTIHRVSVQDAGKYVCSADNGLGQVGEAEITLDVLYPPQVTLDSKHREAEEYESLTVHCNVSANPKPSVVEWVREGRPEFRQSGTVLSLPRVTAESAGVYMCRAVNTLDVSTPPRRRVEHIGNASLTLLVRHKPGLARISPDKPVATEGAGVTLTCSANPPGWPLPQFRWWRDPADSNSSSNGNSPATVLTTGPKYTITSTHLGSEGTYHCQASNEIGQGEPASVFLEVHQPPRFLAKLQPHVTRRVRNDDFTAMCGAQGKPKPSIRWLKDGRDIGAGTPGSGFYDISTEESEARNAVYTVQSILKFSGPDRKEHNQLEPSDRGVYTCIFENEVKKTESTMHLRIEHEPISLNRYNKVAYDLREDAQVVCRVQAYPRPEFQWSYGSNQAALLTSSEGHYEITTSTENGDIYTSVLKVSNIRDVDYGEYTCRANNGLGTKRETIKLQPKGPPEHPQAVKSTAVGHNYVTLLWEAGFDGGVQNTKYFVSYRRVAGGSNTEGGDLASDCYSAAPPSVNANLVSSSEATSGEAGGWQEFDCQKNNPCNVTSLEQHASYVFKVKAYNTKGHSNYSESVAALTKVDRIPAPQRVTYDPESHLLSINIAATCLQLMGQVEASLGIVQDVSTGQEMDEWHLVDTLPIVANGGAATRREAVISSLVASKTHPESGFRSTGRSLGGDDNYYGSEVPEDVLDPEHNAVTQGDPRVRVKLCLRSNPETCGDYTEADIGPSYIKEASVLATPTLIAIVVSCVVFILFVGLLFMFCRCKRHQNKKASGKNYEMNSSNVGPSMVTQPPPPYYPSSGLENKALEHSLDLALDDATKGHHVYAAQNGYGYHGAMPGHQHHGPPQTHGINGGEWVNMGYMENSYSNSNNGGSVNSQDSLWQMKMAAAASNNGSQTGIPSVDPQSQFQHSHPNLHTHGSTYGYDPMSHGGYGAVDDYAAYPQQPGDLDYGHHMNQGRNSANPSRQEYAPSGDPYAAVQKPRRRMDQHIDSPYHDVSGLPDPYMEQMDQQMDDKQPHMGMPYDESLESGYSTPNSRNRRVIREIIV
ncbi:uncharacterized protein LOC117645893 isoform X4 [Thrips palmi]|uniref:Uncharacterized protein LOC117645893 isoform X4 n=1 Tax=Thrips palmi TaxID=161013 RepID=A0A6P8ZNG8_THRPL|nr:uncharacterized protein LOC117645893 isoform X4 [Thrips palmi]